jgi:large-conductance mechanosensitive channel
MYSSILAYKFFTDFQKFIFSNNILATATGFSIGVATKEVIEKILNAIIIPSLLWIFDFFNVTFLKNNKLLTVPFEIIWFIIVWITTIIFTFLLLEYFLNRTVFGLKSTIKIDEKKEFIKSKAEAKINSIIPIKQEDREDITKEKKQDEAIVKKTIEEGTSKIDKIITDEIKHNTENFLALDPYNNIENFQAVDPYNVNFSPINFLN